MITDRATYIGNINLILRLAPFLSFDYISYVKRGIYQHMKNEIL